MSKRIIAAMVVVLCAAGAWAEDAPQIAWKIQVGTNAEDSSRGVDVDAAGNVYVSGYTEGAAGGADIDTFVTKYDADGNEAWTTSISSAGVDVNSSIAVDAAGNSWVTGFTRGDLGGPNAGEEDAYLSKLDSAGNEVWTTQMGTARNDRGNAVVVDAAGNAYVSGQTNGDLGGVNPSVGRDAFVAKYDVDGNEVWSNQIGIHGADFCYDIDIDAAGNVYIGGFTDGDLGGDNAGLYDAYISKFNTLGEHVWTTQIGTSSIEESHGLVVGDWGDIYLVGSTRGELGGPTENGAEDVYVTRLATDGNVVWTTQIGTAMDDSATAVDLDSSGNIYVTGRTRGGLGGNNAGRPDVFFSKFDPAGVELWTTQFGTSEDEAALSIVIDGSDAYLAGCTFGDLAGLNAGSADGFLVKYESVPEPASLSLLALGGLAVLRGRKK